MAGEQPIYPFKYAEVKEDGKDRCTLTFFLTELTPKHTVDASISVRTLTVQTEVGGKLYQSKPELPGEAEQGKLSTVKVKDGRVHVTFKKLEKFSMTKISR